MPGEFQADVPAGSITAWQAGAGPPVLILHGGPGLSDYTAPLAAELEDGAASPIPPEHGLASAALIPGARYQIEQDCGHFPWLERPGSVRKAVDRISKHLGVRPQPTLCSIVPAPAGSMLHRAALNTVAVW